MAKLFIVGKTFKLKKRIIHVGNSVVTVSTKRLLQRNFQITEVSPNDLKDYIKWKHNNIRIHICSYEKAPSCLDLGLFLFVFLTSSDP